MRNGELLCGTAIGLAVAILVAGISHGQSLIWDAVNVASGTSFSGGHVFENSVGQTVVGTSTLGDDHLYSGFWQSFDAMHSVCGDCDGSGQINISDAVYLVNYIFAGGTIPQDSRSGDINCSGQVNIGDAVYMVNYIFASGPSPCANCGFSVLKLTRGQANLQMERSVVDPDRSEIRMRTSASLAMQAAQMNFVSQGVVENIEVTNPDSRFQVFAGFVDGEFRVGLIDLTGEATFPPGVNQLLTISYSGDGNLTLRDVIVVDSNAEPMVTTIRTTKAEGTLPTELALSQNHPNPFNPSTEISFSLPHSGKAKLVIYNILGAEVATLVDETRAAGIHRVTWNGQDNSGKIVASGVYLYRLTASDLSVTKKMMMLK